MTRGGRDIGELTPKVAIVAGASVGIGRAGALALAAEGAAVVVADVDARGDQVAPVAIVQCCVISALVRICRDGALDVFHDDDLATSLREVGDRVKDASPTPVVETVRLDLLAALQSRRRR